MKPIIGILVRNENNKYYIRENIVKFIVDKDCIPLGVFNNEKNILDVCDGIILPGGDDIEKEDLLFIKNIYDKNIPCLGICLGMQEMGCLFDGKMNNISNYNHLKPNVDYVHNIKINKDSKLYQIINKEEIKVNSRHKDYLISTKLNISSISDVIESVEDRNKNFFIGVQWHPEDMLLYDNNSNLLIEKFIEECHIYQTRKRNNII